MTMGPHEIIDRLCLLAGMIMEDVSLHAISKAAGNDGERRKRLASLKQAGADIGALLAAAEVVERYSRTNDS